VASALGASIAEFPTTLAAARAARGHGQAMVTGAPTWGISLTNSLTAGEALSAGYRDRLGERLLPGGHLPGCPGRDPGREGLEVMSSQKVVTAQVWPDLPPPTLLLTPSLVGAGMFVVQVRAPPIRLPEMVVPPRLALEVTAPPM